MCNYIFRDNFVYNFVIFPILGGGIVTICLNWGADLYPRVIYGVVSHQLQEVLLLKSNHLHVLFATVGKVC